jgi:Domain of unknown function (DUF5666)
VIRPRPVGARVDAAYGSWRLLAGRLTVLLLAAGAVLSAAGIAGAAAGDARTVTGTIEWPLVLHDQSFLVLEAGDGVPFYVDVALARRRTHLPLEAGDRVMIEGFEGDRPNELRATEVSALAPSLALSTPTPSAAPLATPAPPRDLSTTRLDGRVQSASRAVLVLRESSGRTVAVDASAVVGSEELRRGANVTVFVVGQPDGRLVATGLVRLER